MPDSELVKQLKKKLPGIPIIMFNSDEDFALKSIHYPDPIDSTVKALGDMALSHESNDCRKCGKAASLVCSACRGLPTGDHDGKMNIRFCSADCQKESWKTHKIDCKAAKHRALLYRSASLSKSLFYIHQRTSFAWGYFDNIEKHGPVRVVHLQQPKSQTRKSMLVPFSTVTDLVSDPLEQEAFLTHLSCAGAIINSGPMLAGMIKDITSSIEEITLIPKNLQIEILQGLVADGQPAVRKDGWNHVVFRVTLKNNEQYAVDLTGAQHGHHQECMKWDEYVTSRAETIVSTAAFGSTKQDRDEQEERNGKSLRTLVNDLNDFFANETRLAVRYWAREEGSMDGSLDRMLALPEKAYEQERGSLLTRVGKLMELSREDSLRQKRWCRK